MSKPGAPARKTVQSAETGLTVLKVLGQLGGAATLTRLAAALEENSAKVHRYLSSLVSAGFVAQDAATSRYFLGPEAILLGLAAQRQSDVLRLAGAEIARLAEALDVSCFVAVMGSHGPVIVRWEEPVHAIVVNVRGLVGSGGPGDPEADPGGECDTGDTAEGVCGRRQPRHLLVAGDDQSDHQRLGAEEDGQRQ